MDGTINIHSRTTDKEKLQKTPVLWFSRYLFDAVVFEVYTSLMGQGHCLYMPSQKVIKIPHDLV